MLDSVTNFPRVSLLHCTVDAVTKKQALTLIQSFVQSRHPHQIVTLNSEMFLAFQHDPRVSDILLTAALVVPDSYGIVWSARQLGVALPEQIPGIELAEELLTLASRNGWRVFLLGGQPTIADKAAQSLRIQQLALTIVGTHHGYFSGEEEPNIVAMIQDAQPDILLVGMGFPKQELWIYQHLIELRIPVVMGIGGSFDVWSGRLKRAPHWIRKCRTEWLYRLIQEPQRIARMIYLPKFILHVLKQKRIQKKLEDFK